MNTPTLAEQVMKLAAGGEQTYQPVAEGLDSGTNLTERPASDDSSDSWQPISKLVDPKQIKAPPPISEGSKKFIENLRQSITKAGTRELTPPERDIDDRKLSGEWRRTGDGQDDDEEDLAPNRELMPAAPLRKQTGDHKVSLEDRAIAENILPNDFNEQQLSVKRLRDRTTGGKYHVYLSIYAICIVLAFAIQRVVGPEALQVMREAGQAVTSSVSRMMLPNAIATFSNGLKTFEDEEVRQMAARKQPVNFITQLVTSVSAGWDAAAKTATQDGSGGSAVKHRFWFSMPTGFVLGWPAAALYTVRQTFNASGNNKSGFELTLIALMYVAVAAHSSIVYMKLTNLLAAVPKFAAPVIVILLMSIVSIVIWAVLSFSLTVCKVPMPDTIEMFTDIAIMIIAGVAAKFSFVAPKKRQVDPRLL